MGPWAPLAAQNQDYFRRGQGGWRGREHPRAARAADCGTAGRHRDHRRKLQFWSLSSFPNVFHFSSWGLHVIWVLQHPGLLRRDLPVREWQEETQPPPPPAPGSTRQGSELSLHHIVRQRSPSPGPSAQTHAARQGEVVFTHPLVLAVGRAVLHARLLLGFIFFLPRRGCCPRLKRPTPAQTSNYGRAGRRAGA